MHHDIGGRGHGADKARTKRGQRFGFFSSKLLSAMCPRSVRAVSASPESSDAGSETRLEDLLHAGEGHARMFTARAATSAIVSNEMSASSSIISFIRDVSGSVSVG